MSNLSNRAMTSTPHKVAALVYDGLCAFEYGIAAEIFGLPRPELGAPLYTFRSIAFEPGPLSLSGGLTFQADHDLSALAETDTLIIPGWRGKDAPVPDDLCRAIRDAHARGVRMLTICSGVYVLAAAGLLSGKQVTTHWRYAEDLAAKYPDINVTAESLYIEDDNIITSAGSSAGIDACLHVVRSDYGAEIANSVARRLVMHAHRQGDQAQYIERPLPSAPDGERLSRVIAHVQSQIKEAHSVASLSRQAGMSSRTFQRRFIALTGLPPMKWVTSERVDAARLLLETTSLSVEAISESAGFSQAEALRYHFRKSLGVSPLSYRKRFKSPAT